jgi:hypothetical protein
MVKCQRFGAIYFSLTKTFTSAAKDIRKLAVNRTAMMAYAALVERRLAA